MPLLDSGLAGTRERGPERARHRRASPARYGNAHPNIVPYETFETASGRIAIAAANDGLFRALCGVLGLDELAADERFASNAARVEHRGELIPLLAAAAARAAGRGVAGGARRGRRAGREGAHGARGAGGGRGGRAAGHGDRRAPDAPARSTWWPRRSGASPRSASGAAAAAWASTPREVLGELGRSTEEIAALAERGVVR